MRKVTLSLFALLSLMVLMMPLVYASEPPDGFGPTSLEVWLEIDSISTVPINDEILLWIDVRVVIMNVGEHVAQIGDWVWITWEHKMKQEPWNWLLMVGQYQEDWFIDPGQTDELGFACWTFFELIPDAVAFRLLAEVELLNHPTGLRVFPYRMSFELPEM